MFVDRSRLGCKDGTFVISIGAGAGVGSSGKFYSKAVSDGFPGTPSLQGKGDGIITCSIADARLVRAGVGVTVERGWAFRNAGKLSPRLVGIFSRTRPTRERQILTPRPPPPNSQTSARSEASVAAVESSQPVFFKGIKVFKISQDKSRARLRPNASLFTQRRI